jgi:hypothetical protein
MERAESDREEVYSSKHLPEIKTTVVWITSKVTKVLDENECLVVLRIEDL